MRNIAAAMFCVLLFLSAPIECHGDSSIGELHEFLDPDANPDGDSLTNAEEWKYGTDPFNPDTDGDGVPE